jgi:ketosteroid isomerase-like protein
MTKAMGIEENKKLARRQWEALGAGNFDLMGQGYDDNVLYHGGAGEERRGKAAALDLAKMYRTAFPDVRVTIEDMIAEGDRVFTRVRRTARSSRSGRSSTRWTSCGSSGRFHQRHRPPGAGFLCSPVTSSMQAWLSGNGR